MSNNFLGTLVTFLTLTGSCLAQQSGLNSPVAIGPYLNGVLPPVAPGTSTGWNAVNAFPNLTFVDPLWLTPVPGSSDLLLVGKNGQIWRFPNNENTMQTQVVKVLEWSSKTQTSEDQGFYSLAFHPEFGLVGSPNKNYVYVCYNYKPSLPGADPNHSYWHVSRFTWQTASGTLDPASEFVLIKQYDPDLWHNGGAMYFDNNGFLNVVCGDGGDADETGGLAGAMARSQKLNGGFFGGLFRIDVNNNVTRSHPIRRQPSSPAPPAGWPASATQGYRIPDDNPFLDPGGSILEEYSAIGFRSPHTAHYDAVEDVAWVGDVGGGSREEVSKIIRGSNAQWGYKEGTIAGPGIAAVPPIGIDTPPFLDYSHSVGSCIIGGMRYRGSKWNSLLGGKLLYGDHLRGVIWSSVIDSNGGPPTRELLVEGFHTGNKAGLANFCTDAAGEIYLMNLNGTNNAGGTINKLVSAGISGEPPQFLSQTGVFTNLTTLATSPGILPYNVATPLWSDGAEKKRWIALPNDGTHNTPAEDIAFSANGNWVFPAGTVFVKHFEMSTNQNDPSQIKRLETRLLICTANGGKYGVTYKWNSTGTDAELLSNGTSEDYIYTQLGGGTVTRRWDFPSRGDCLLCHNTASGQALGVATASLNMDYFYPSTGRTANQLLTFNSLGMFDRTLTVSELENFIASRSIDDTTAPLEHRVRSYLASNCSHCHQPGGPVDYFDARIGTPLVKQGMINGPLLGHFNLPGGEYIKPGDPSLSATAVRLSNVGNGQAMPPLAKNVVDQKAVELLNSYITGIDAQQVQVTAITSARYVRLTGLSEVNGNAWSSAAEFSVLDSSGRPIPAADLSIATFDSQEIAGEFAPAAQAIDGNPSTYWHTAWSEASDPPPPHYITVDLGMIRPIGGYVYIPRQDGPNGRIADYLVEYSSNGTTWTTVDTGTWSNDATTKTFSGLVNLRKARCEIAGPSGSPVGNFDVTIAFDTDVTDFTAADVQVKGGTVAKLRGQGYYYVATISPSQSHVSVVIPHDVAYGNVLGNFASNNFSLGTDTTGPNVTYSGVPSGNIAGPFTLGIHFDEIPAGFSLTSLSASHASLSHLSGSDVNYTVLVTPLEPGNVTVTLSANGITDSTGNPMTTAAVVTIPYDPYQLFAEAENGILAGGMARVSSAGNSGGAHIWLPNGTFPDNEATVNTANSATYTFIVPRSGTWKLEGLVRSDDASSNSFWIGIDGGTPYNWSTNDGSVGSGTFSWDTLNAASSQVILINPTTRNGSFESLGGSSPATAKASHWDNDPDGNVDNWTVWDATSGGPSTIANDSGTEVNGSASQGSRIAFLQNGNAAYNLTDHVIEAGDVFTYSWDYVSPNRGTANAQLAYKDGNSIVSILGTQVSNPNTARRLGITGAWTVPSGHASVGHLVAITLRSNGSYPEIDNVILKFQGPSLDPVPLSLAAGSHTLTVYGREDGTRLDAMRLISDRPLVALISPQTSVEPSTVVVGVSFSKAVTGLTGSDFQISGATVSSLTGSGASYMLALAPTGPLVTVSLPEDVTLDDNGNGNLESETSTTIIRTLFDQWAAEHGLGGITPGGDSNHDGVMALTEFLLNLNPTTSSTWMFDPALGPYGLPKVSRQNNNLVLEFPRNADAVARGYRYIGQFSSDMITWDSVETGTLMPLAAPWGHMKIQDPIITATSAPRFVRLKLSAP